MRKKKSDKPKEKNRAEEPLVNYSEAKNLSQVFGNLTISTLKEEEDKMREYSSSLSPVDRMGYLYELIQRAYAHVLNDPTLNLWEKKIHIKKPE